MIFELIYFNFDKFKYIIFYKIVYYYALFWHLISKNSETIAMIEIQNALKL